MIPSAYPVGSAFSMNPASAPFHGFLSHLLPEPSMSSCQISLGPGYAPEAPVLLGRQPSPLTRLQTLVLTHQGPLSAKAFWVFFRGVASAGPPESESSSTHSGLCPCASSSGAPVIGLSLLIALHPFPTLLLPAHPSFLELLPVETHFRGPRRGG